MKKFPSNPLMANDVYVPDVEARVFADGRLYVYGTFERTSRTTEECNCFHVYSTADMVEWVDHGVAFSVKDIHWTTTTALWAPDCIYRNGKYYLYYCVPGGEEGGGKYRCCGVATSDTPYGPFQDVGRIVGTDGIDPAVFIDDDNQAYLYWGQRDDVRVAKLKENMTEIEIESITQPLSEKEHEFHEGISVRKIGNKYYCLYTDTHRHGRRATAQGYAVSNNPMTGFVYKNIIVDNFGCDPETWNNHGSLECFHGQWYIFYHRSTHGTRRFRQLCAEPITIDENGDIAEVPMTSSGHGKEIAAEQEIPACYACRLHGNARIAYDEKSVYDLSLQQIQANDMAYFCYLRFNGECGARIRIKTDAPCRVELYVDGAYHSAFKVSVCKEYATLSWDMPAIYGKCGIEFRFYGQGFNAALDSIQFYK